MVQISDKFIHTFFIDNPLRQPVSFFISSISKAKLSSIYNLTCFFYTISNHVLLYFPTFSGKCLPHLLLRNLVTLCKLVPCLPLIFFRGVSPTILKRSSYPYLHIHPWMINVEVRIVVGPFKVHVYFCICPLKGLLKYIGPFKVHW